MLMIFDLENSLTVKIVKLGFDMNNYAYSLIEGNCLKLISNDIFAFVT